MRIRYLTCLLVLMVGLCFGDLAHAQIKTITKTIRQPFGGVQSPEDARITALTRAKRSALEQAGTYIESLTEVRDGMLESDDIMAIAAGVLSTEILKEKKYVEGDSFGIEVTALVRVDQSVLEQRVKAFLEDRRALENYRELEKRQVELLKRIKRLEADNENLKNGSNEQRQGLKEEYTQVTEGLVASDWLSKGWSARDSNQELEYYNKAIATDPEYALAYYSRAFYYQINDQFHKSLRDINRVIELEPENAEAYRFRGDVYKLMDQPQNAIRDYNKSIELNPDYYRAYSDRGTVYLDNGQFEIAVQDYTKAIALDPEYESAYYYRGESYSAMGRNRKALADYNKAIALDSEDGFAYYGRGNVYFEMDEHRKAVEDYNKVIDFGLADGWVYNNRGISYFSLGDYDNACRDAEKGAELGVGTALKLLREEGECR